MQGGVSVCEQCIYYFVSFAHWSNPPRLPKTVSIGAFPCGGTAVLSPRLTQGVSLPARKAHPPSGVCSQDPGHVALRTQ